MAGLLHQLLDDLAEESRQLDALLADLDEDAWVLGTPAAGWRIGDHVTHLSYFDDATVVAVTDPDRFTAEAGALVAHGPDFAAYVARQFADVGGAERLAWLRRSRAALLEAFAPIDPKARLPWYGPSMSATSALTARLMETWAHGQDVADTLGAERAPSTRLRHVAHLGVQTFAFSFTLRGLAPPAAAPRVELAAPDGSTWTWGPDDAEELVSGPAVDFCLVVTQRRPLAETALVAAGPVSRQWLSIAQAYAGPPGTGRTGRTGRTG